MPEQPMLHVGVARVDITPPIGIELSGYAGREPSVGVRDPLCATAVCFDVGGERAVIVALDLIGVDAALTRDITRKTSDCAGVASDRVLLCCSHTHYGPETRRVDEDPRTSDKAAYLANLEFAIAGAAGAAASALQPAIARVGRSECLAGVNRRERRPDGTIVLGRNPGGPIDRELIALRLETPAGEPLCCITNFACHGTSQTNAGRMISSDFIDTARDVVEEALDAPFVFLQGACGNINPEARGPSGPVRAGRLVASATIEAWEMAEEVSASPLLFEVRDLTLPLKMFGTVEEAERVVSALSDELANAREMGAQPSMIRYLSWRLDGARAALEAMTTGTPAPPVQTQLVVLRLGDVAFATAPGEIFSEIGRTIKNRSPIPHTLFVGYTNDSIGYVPVPEAFAEGGYEVDAASRVSPDAAPMLIQHALDMLGGLVA